MTLYIFNPEHDICLANGDRNFVPPQSALDFAREGVGLMKVLYGDDSEVICAEDYHRWRNSHAEPDNIVPWGWNLRLKQQLLKQGAEPSLLPADDWLEKLRNMQHRSTILPLQPHAASVVSVDEVVLFVERYKSIVLKAPWSGAGRGLRWVDSKLSATDESWIKKIVSMQRSVIVEKRLRVADDFALEMEIKNHKAESKGMSLFVTQSGVYRHNILLPDEAIRERVRFDSEREALLLHWVQTNIATFYDGPLGIDMIHAEDGGIYVSELNLRHTMGMVAHKMMEIHQDKSNDNDNPKSILNVII